MQENNQELNKHAAAGSPTVQPTLDDLWRIHQMRADRRYRKFLRRARRQGVGPFDLLTRDLLLGREILTRPQIQREPGTYSASTYMRACSNPEAS